MPQASSLADLIRIRDANRDYIDSINGNLGSALGFKKTAGEVPAVLIFVPRKIDPKWLPGSQRIRKQLDGPDGLTCPVDVIEGGKYEEIYLQGQDPDRGDKFLVPWSELKTPPALDEAGLRLRERLRGWTDRITPGAQLAGFDTQGNGYYGTLGCFARTRGNGELGFLTNQHVADHVGNTLRFPVHHGRKVGTVRKTVEWLQDEQRFAGLIDEPDALFRMDCAFARLSPDIDVANDLDPGLPIADSNGTLTSAPLGPPLSLDLNTMGPLGTRVLGVGRTRSLQRGTIVAFAYEWVDEDAGSYYTDYLIVGEDGGHFSDHGDSGKIIVTDDGNCQPVALLWGGWNERLRHGREQENWTYAIDINAVLRLLEVEIVRTF